MPWNQGLFERGFQQKYAIMGQNANADTTRANATAQSVNQQPMLQQMQNQGVLDATNLRGQFGLQEQQLRNDGGLAAENARGGFGLQERTLANKGAADVANIHGGYALEGARIHGGYALEGARIQGKSAADVANINGGYGLEDARIRAQPGLQPQYDTVPNPYYDPKVPGSRPYYSAPKNGAAMDRPPTLPSDLPRY